MNSTRIFPVPKTLKPVVFSFFFVLLTFIVPRQTTHAQAVDDVTFSGSINGAFYGTPNKTDQFSTTPSDTPDFRQSFPGLNFNPPSAFDIIPCSNTTNVSKDTLPFTDIVPQPGGTCTTIVAQGSGIQAGLAPEATFNAVFTGNLTVSQPGNVTFNIYADDGFVFSLGKSNGTQPAYVSGSMVDAPATGPFTGYRVVGAFNDSGTSNSPYNLVINFPKAGTYPFEMDYNQALKPYLVLVITANSTPILPGYSVTGNVYDDYNKNGIIDNGETNYTGGISISSSDGIITTNTNGTYTITGIPQGNATVSYTSLPNNYNMTYPVNGPPPSFNISVGYQCLTNGAKGAACNAGAITNLNFGITNLQTWWQATCSDVEDDGITDLLPAGAVALKSAASCSNSPGIVFTGGTDPNFGQGQASSTNQVIGGSSYPETSSQNIATSYSSLLSKAQNAGITPTNLSTVCTLSNCTLPATLTHGIYIANGNVTLNTFTFPANQDYVFLINGTLTLNGNISVPVGSTALFSTSGNIVVANSVGSAPTVTTASLNGWFIAGQSFIINSVGNCNDLRLNIAGSVVVDSAGNGGTFQNNRDLCSNDTLDPTVTFSQRLDFILNAPQFLEQQQTVSQEVNP